MRVGYHPAVQREVGRMLRHYDRITPQLGDAFWDELMDRPNDEERDRAAVPVERPRRAPRHRSSESLGRFTRL